MTNIFDETLEIITIQDYKDSSNSELTTKSDDEIVKYIKQAEKIVYKYTTNVDITDNDVKKAVILITDCLYSTPTDNGNIKAEKRGMNYVLYSEKKQDYNYRCLNDDIIILLSKYKNTNTKGVKWFRT